MGIIERRKALIEKSKKWAEEASLETSNSMPIKKSEIDPRLKEHAQKWLNLTSIIIMTFIGYKGLEGVINQKKSSEENESTAHTQTINNEDSNQSTESANEGSAFEISSEKRVYVSGTGSDGLLLRKEPGTNAEILSSAWDGETFIFTGKTANQDGYVWYQLKDEVSGNIYWAASDYLN